MYTLSLLRLFELNEAFVFPDSETALIVTLRNDQKLEAN